VLWYNFVSYKLFVTQNMRNVELKNYLKRNGVIMEVSDRSVPEKPAKVLHREVA